MANDLTTIIRNKLLEHKGDYPRLVGLTGCKVDVMRRMARNKAYSPTIRNIQPLLDYFGLVVVEKDKVK
jgi:hypothetical protein